MNEAIKQSLQQAQIMIRSGNLNEASKILEPLKQAYPESSDIALLWCAMTMKAGRTSEVLSYATQIFSIVVGDLHKARWAQMMGTACFQSLNLETACSHYSTALNHLMALTRSGKVPANQQSKMAKESPDNIFLSGRAEQLLWETCAALAANGIQAFPFAGTLLGIVRHGHLLAFDKDVDIAVWMENWSDCCELLEKMGWQRTPMSFNYSNYRDYVHSEIGITLDLCGLQLSKAERITGGFSLPGYPDEYQRVSIFPKFDLIQRETMYGKVWFPNPPETILAAFYGNWRTPNPYWDTVVSAVNLEKFTLLVRCFAYYRLIQRWLSGDLMRAWCYAHQIVLKDPDDVICLRSRQWLERALTRLNQAIPEWPSNRPQKRVYTRMVADLFHVGHINFLREAKALGTHLTVFVVSDQRVQENKGKHPVMSQSERAAVVSACKYVDAVVTEGPLHATPEFMQERGYDVYTFACSSEKERQEKYKLCAALPASMIKEIDYTEGISTTDLLARVTQDHNLS